MNNSQYGGFSNYQQAPPAPAPYNGYVPQGQPTSAPHYGYGYQTTPPSGAAPGSITGYSAPGQQNQGYGNYQL